MKALLAKAELPVSDLTEAHCEHFFFAGDAAAPTGIAGLELHGGAALLRSLVVVPEKRAMGVGRALVEYAEKFAHGTGVREIYLLTTTAEAFFLARGYGLAPRESAPPAIRSTREFSSICPASCAFMAKKI